MTNAPLRPDAVLDFWFVESTSKLWWSKSDAFDAAIRERFAEVHAAAARCELYDWRDTPRGRLAEVLVLDQFSRHLYRDDARAFACDPLALALAQTAVAVGADRALPPGWRAFLYMPYMHSESPRIQAESVALFSQPGLEGNRDFAQRHKAIIERFGRYPHRNAALGRASTPEEIEFLRTPGSAF